MKKKKSLETLIFQGFSTTETRGIRTPDNLIKRQVINVLFMRFSKVGVHRSVHYDEEMPKNQAKELTPSSEPFLMFCHKHHSVCG